jgi:WD40 repeat protein
VSRAGELIDRFAARRPLAVRLAEAVSLAVLADPVLLRKARLELVPEADPGTEADLWLSPIVQTRSPDGIVFATEVGEALRNRLAADTARLEKAWKTTQAVHRHLTPALRLEEEIAFLSLTSESDPRAASRIEELLRSALAAVVMGEMRGLAHWAARALPKLPSRVRVTQAARMLEAGAHLRLGGDTRPVGGRKTIPDWLPWVAPADLPRVPIGVRLFADALELDARADPPGQRLLLPQTDPLLVELSWNDPASGEPDARQVTFRKGEAKKVEVPTADLRLRTVLGEVYNLRAAGTAPRGVQDWIIDFSEELARHRPFFGRYEERVKIEDGMRRAQGLALVTGETGAGKTALLAHLVTSDTPHHFFRPGGDLEDIGRAERSLIGQIVRRFPELAPMAAHVGLMTILQTVSDRGLVSPKTGPLVLVLDAVEVARSADGMSGELRPLLAPSRLPEGVVVLASAAPDRTLDLPQPVDHVPLTDPDPSLYEYWSHHLGKESADSFTRLSAGSFGVAQVLHAWVGLEGRAFVGGDRGALAAIWESLASQIGREARDAWLGSLAAAREPLPSSIFYGVASGDFLQSALRQLLRVRETAGEPLCELREEVLRGFIVAQLDMADPHRRLAENATAAMFDESSSEQARRYSLRHAVEHWIAAGDLESAYRLLLRADYLTTRCREDGVAAARRDLRRWFDALAASTRGPEAAAGATSGVFVIYSTKDRDAVEVLTEGLRSKGSSTFWFAREKLEPGSVWAQEIESALDRSPGALIVLGPSGLGEWQRHEIELASAIRARRAQYRIVPVLLPGAVMPAGLIGSDQAIRFTRSIDEPGPLGQLVAALEGVPANARERVAAVLEALVQKERLLARDPAALPSVLYNALRIDGWSPDDITDTLALPPGEPPLRLRSTPEEVKRPGPIRHRGRINGCVVVDLDGPAVLSWSADGTLRTWDVTNAGLRAVLAGHTGEVTACAPLEQGLAVSASRDCTLRLWDTQTGSLVRTMWGHEGDILGVLALDARMVVSWSADRTLRVWDLTGREMLAFRGHEGAVTACVVSPDHGVLVSGSEDATVRFWNLSTGALIRTCREHTGPVTGLALDPHDNRIASVSLDRTVKLWSLEPQAGQGSVATLERHSLGILGCAFSPDGVLATWSYDRTVRVWVNPIGPHPTVLTGHEGAVLGAAFLPSGDRLVSCSADGTLRIWDVETGAPSPVLRGHEGAVRSVAAIARPGSGLESVPNDLIVSASDDRTLRVWSAPEMVVLDGDDETLFCLPFQDRQRVVTFSRRGDLRVHHTGNPVPDWIGSTSMTVGGGVLTPDNRRLVLWSQGLVDGKVRFTVWDLEERRQVADFSGHDAPILACTVTPGGAALLSASLDGTVRNWSLMKLVDWTEMPAIEEASPVSALATGALPSLGSFALRGTWDGTVVFWFTDRTVGESRFTGHTDRVLACAIGPDGRSAVSASADRTLRLWDLKTGSTLAVLTGHTDEVTGCAFTRDGRRIVSRSKDGRLGLWNGGSGALVVFTQGHTDWVNALAIAEDQGVVYSASEDQTVRAWDLATGEPRGVTYGPSPFRSLAVVQGGVYAGDEAGNLWPLESAAAPTPVSA